MYSTQANVYSNPRDEIVKDAPLLWPKVWITGWESLATGRAEFLIHKTTPNDTKNSSKGFVPLDMI